MPPSMSKCLFLNPHDPDFPTSYKHETLLASDSTTSVVSATMLRTSPIDTTCPTEPSGIPATPPDPPKGPYGPVIKRSGV